MQIRFDFKIHAVVKAIRIAHLIGGVLQRAQFTAEFLRHIVVGQIGNMADHARDAQAVARDDTVFVKMPAMKIRIGQNRLPRHIVKRDILRRQARA